MQTENLELKLYETKTGNFVFNYKGLEMVYFPNTKKVEKNIGGFTSVVAANLQDAEILVLKLLQQNFDNIFSMITDEPFYKMVQQVFVIDFFNQCEFIYRNIELRKLLINARVLEGKEKDEANEHNIKLMLNNFDVFKNDVENILYYHYNILPF